MKTKGFALIELMIVVAIIGILLSVAIPGISRYRCGVRGKHLELDVYGVSELCSGYREDYRGLTKMDALDAISRGEMKFSDFFVFIENEDASQKNPAKTKDTNKEVKSLEKKIEQLKKTIR